MRELLSEWKKLLMFLMMIPTPGLVVKSWRAM